MDPNKRLQTVNSVNPSLRQAALPAPAWLHPAPNLGPLLTNQSPFSIGGLKIQAPNNPPLIRPTPQPAPRPQPQNQRANTAFNRPLYGGGPVNRNIFQQNNPNSDVNNSDDGANGLVNLIKSGGNLITAPFRPFAEGIVNRFTNAPQTLQTAADRANAVNNQAVQTYTNLFKQGKITSQHYQNLLGSINGNNANDINNYLQTTADKSRFLGSATQVAAAPFLGAANLGKNLVAKGALAAGEGGALGLSNEFATNKDPTLKGAAVNTAAGAVLGVGLPAVGTALKKGASKLFTAAERRVLQETGIDTGEEAGVAAENAANDVNRKPTKPAEPVEPPIPPVEESPKLPPGSPEPLPQITNQPLRHLQTIQSEHAKVSKQLVAAANKGDTKAAAALQTKLDGLGQELEAHNGPTQEHAQASQEKVSQAVTDQAPKEVQSVGAPPLEQQQVAREAIAQAGLTKAELKEARRQNLPENLIAQDHVAKGGNLDAQGLPIASDSPTRVKSTIKTENAKAPTKPVKIIPQASQEGKLSRLTSLENRLRNIGQTGQKALQTVRNKEVGERIHTQQLKDLTQPFYDLTPEEQAAAIQVQKGEGTAPTKAVQAGANALKTMFKEAHQRATTAGRKVGNLGDNYFPKSYPKGWFDKPENFNKAAQEMVNSGKAANLEQAVTKLNKLKVEGSLKPSEFGHFKTREKDLPGGVENADTVSSYIKGAAKSIAEAEHFGPKEEALSGHVSDAVRNGEDAGALKSVLNSYVHPAHTGDSAISKGLNAYQRTLRVLQLSKAAVSHLPQGFTNTASDIGYTKYFKSMAKKVFKDPEHERLMNEGGFRVDDFGHSSNLSDKATAPGLGPMLQFHREVAAQGGMSLAEGLARHGDETALGKIGVDGDFARNPDGSINLTDHQRIQAGHFEADKSIGSHSAIQSPAWTQTDSGKLIGMYRKMYTFKQAERISNLFKEAKNGDVAPLARYLAVGLPVSGAVVTTAKDELKDPGSNPFSDPKKFAVDSLRHSGGLSLGYGLADSAVNAAAHNYGPNARWANAAGTVSPGLGTAVQTGQNIDKAVRGNPRALIRETAGFSPIGGKAIADKIAPTPAFGANGKVLKSGETEVPLTDAQNQPILDSKGSPATVVIPKGVTGVSKDILVQEARNKAAAESIKKGLSPQEKVLFDHADQLKGLVDSGKISQDEADQITAYKKTVSNQTKAPSVLPKSLDSNIAQYTKATDKLTDKGKDNWIKNTTPGKALSQKIADELNSQLPDGIDKLPASKDLVEAYAKFDKERATAAQDKDPNKQWDEIVTRGKLRNFWKDAIEKSQPKEVKEIYGLSMTQLKDYFIKNKKVTMEQLKAAVALNDDLLAADLSDSNKYSKKFRATFGLADAPEIGSAAGTKGSYTRGGSKSPFGSGRATKSGGISTKFTDQFGNITTRSVDPKTGMDTNKPIGLSKLVPGNLSFSQPVINKVPTKKTFKLTLPADLTGHPRPQRVVSLRAKRARII